MPQSRTPPRGGTTSGIVRFRAAASSAAVGRDVIAERYPACIRVRCAGHDPPITLSRRSFTERWRLGPRAASRGWEAALSPVRVLLLEQGAQDVLHDAAVAVVVALTRGVDADDGLEL